MKKFFCGVIVGTVLASTVAFAASYVADIASFKVYLDGKEFKSDPPALVVEGRTYLPLRAIGDALGVPVEWNSDENRVEIGDCSQIKQYQHYHTLGDSLTLTNLAGNDLTGYMYYTTVGKNCNIEKVTSDAKGGGRLAYSSSEIPSGVKRLGDIPKDADLISIFMGSNDFGKGVPLGSIDEDTPQTYEKATTFYGALKYTCEYIKTNFPNATYFFITPPPRYDTTEAGFEKYLSAIKEVARLYDAKVFDLNGAFGSEFVAENYFDDKLHLSRQGQVLAGEKIADFINTELN